MVFTRKKTNNNNNKNHSQIAARNPPSPSRPFCRDLVAGLPSLRASSPSAGSGHSAVNCWPLPRGWRRCCWSRHTPEGGGDLGTLSCDRQLIRLPRARMSQRQTKLLIFPGHMFSNMPVLGHGNMADSWRKAKVLTYFQERMGMVPHPEEGFMGRGG